MKTTYLLCVACLLLVACQQKETSEPAPPPAPMTYFPPTTGDEWETTSLAQLAWDSLAANELYTYLADQGTRAFVVLVNGRIVIERYWGNNIFGNAPFNRDAVWYWASAGKTLTATLTGIAQEQGLLRLSDPTSDYLGQGWSQLTPEQEEKIQIVHQLTMTTGLDYTVSQLDCTQPACLRYRAEPGTQWYYHNAPYTLLESVISRAAGVPYQQFTDQNIEQPIGMRGEWIPSGNNVVYWSNARSAARFGLLLLNKGRWAAQTILADTAYLRQLATPSQDLNPSYGYLTWLNGQSAIQMPGSPLRFARSLAPSAPADLYAAMGRDGQFIDVVPSLNMVVVRMGVAPNDDLVPVIFHDEMWKRIMRMQ